MKHVVKLDNEKFKGMTFNIDEPDNKQEFIDTTSYLETRHFNIDESRCLGSLSDFMNGKIQSEPEEDVLFSRLLELKTSKGKIYRHFKGDLYLILDLAEHTETGDELVIYKALYGDCKVYARPLKMFLEKVPEGKPNPTGQTYRLELVNLESVKEK